MIALPQNVRTRLTAWYVGILAATLFIYILGTSTLVLYELRGELDHLGVDDLESVEGLLSFGPNGQLSFRSNYHDHPYPSSAQDRLLEVRDENGSVLYRNELLGSRMLGGVPSPSERSGDGYTLRSIRMSDGTRVRVISKRHVIDGKATLVRVGFEEDILWQRFWQIALSMMAGLPLALGLAGIGGYFLARRALNPIEDLTKRVQQINADRLHERLKIENPDDELGALARAFNDTLAQLERSFEQLRRFTADASHELRTPLTAIRSVGEVGLSRSNNAADYSEVIGSMLEEASRLSRLVDNMLLIAQAESGQIQLHRKTVTLLPFVRDGLAFLDVLVEEKGQLLLIEGDETVEVQADGDTLRQVLVNVVHNAIKNSPLGAAVTVRVRASGEPNAMIEVVDAGPGIPAEHRDKVFERFYRVDEGRSRDAGGTGLGLAIAKWGIEAHGGHLELECPAAGGCIFRVVLPVAALPPRMVRKNSEERPSLPKGIHLDAGKPVRNFSIPKSA